MPVRPVPLQQAAGPLLDLVRAAAADRDLWQPHVRFDAGRRHWSRLLTGAGVELWLLTWLPAQGTDLHDHGGSAAALTVLSGRLAEVTAAPDGALSRVELGAGEARYVAPDVVHDVTHAGEGPAVSLHAYAPRLTSMTFYDVIGGRLVATRTVQSDEPELEVAS